MPHRPSLIKIFLASPRDVTDERGIAVGVIERLQYDPLLRGAATFQIVAWDWPGSGPPLLATTTPQAALNTGQPRPSECDIVVVILWARMGTPLPCPPY